MDRLKIKWVSFLHLQDVQLNKHWLKMHYADEVDDILNEKDKEIERLKKENEKLTKKIFKYNAISDDLTIYGDALKEEIDDRIYLFYQALKDE